MKKKIFFLIPTLSVGGGERVVSELSRAFAKTHEVKIVLLKNEISYPHAGQVISLDVELSKNVFLKIYNYAKALIRFKKIAKREKPDYVISLGHIANIINILSGERAIVRADNFFSKSLNGFGGNIYKILIRMLFSRAYLVVAVSKASAADLALHFGVKKEKIKVMYNPLNVGEIEMLAREPLGKEYEEIFKNPVIINMGRLSRQKGQEHLIEAFYQIKSKIKNAKLLILGTGELEASLKSLCEKMGLKPDVHFLGWQKNPFSFLARSKLFVLSSLWEGLPYVMLEAMACGLPIASFDCESGPREILAPDTDVSFEAKNIEYAKYGILVKKEDTKLLSQAVVEILSKEDLIRKFKEKSKERALDFDIKNIVEEWVFLN
ncbi:MAG: glycosyltransferase [bacterium]|nr:glycosyltransferase [bacterium]